MSHPQTQAKNRRASTRRQVKGSTKITCHKGTLGLGPNLAVALLDLSETGLRMVVKGALEKGQHIEIGLTSVAHCRPVKVVAQVVWSVETAEGQYAIGAHFQRPIPYGDFLQLAR